MHGGTRLCGCIGRSFTQPKLSCVSPQLTALPVIVSNISRRARITSDWPPSVLYDSSIRRAVPGKRLARARAASQVCVSQGQVTCPPVQPGQLQGILGANSQSAVDLLLAECPDILKLQTPVVLSRISQLQKRHEHINSADLIFIQPSILLTESSEADELTSRAQHILQRYVERERVVYKTQIQLADLIPYYKGAFYEILYYFREVAQNGLWFGFESSNRIRKAAALLNEDRLTAALQEVLADKEKRIKAQEDVSPAGLSIDQLQKLLVVNSEVAVKDLLQECPEIAKLEPSLILSRLIRLKEQDSIPLTPTDLVFLEPRILLVDDPFAAWPQTMQTIQRIAEAIRQMMIREDVYLSTDEDHEEIDWQGTIHFSDAVPYVDNFYARMELVKKGASAWNDANCEQSLHGKIHAALDRRIDFYATECSLRESLSAQGLDTQLSRAKLQKLKVEDLREAVELLPWNHQPSDTSKMGKAELVQTLCHKLQLILDTTTTGRSLPAAAEPLADAPRKSEGELHYRIKTWSDEALLEHINKIQDFGRLWTFTQAIENCEKYRLAVEARRRLRQIDNKLYDIVCR